MTLGESRARPSAIADGYELLHEIGRGAMGVVWLARERSLNRIVALKLIRAGADPQLRQRLLREGRAAARLRHPHIVSLHAMGECDEGAFLAMEYLEGGNLGELVKSRQMSPREAAGVVAKLAAALECAHAAGVLHRDLKPSNILLNLDEEPCLADFGLAAPVEGAGDLTSVGEVAGTPSYLAPELLEGSDRASIASDVYGLGAILYVCLTGRPPFVGDSAASIFAQLAQSDVLAPRLLRPEIPRDLETVCLKCLEKAPARRYRSAREFQGDLERFLRGEAVTARRAPGWEKTVRWCRRRPGAASAVALGAALTMLLAVGGPLIALRLERARRQADTEAASSRAVRDFLQHDLLQQAAPDHDPDRELSLRTVLDRASGRIEGRFPHSPLVEAAVEDTLAGTYSSLGLYPLAEHHWQRAYALRAGASGPDDPEAIRTVISLIDCLRAEGKLPEAVKLGERTVAQAKRVWGPENRDTLTAMANLATALDYEKKFALSEPLSRQVFAIRERLLGPKDPDTILAMSNLAFEYEGEGKFTDAETLCRRVLDLRTRLLGPMHPDTLLSTNNLGAIYSDEGRFAEAAASHAMVVDGLRRVCGPEHPKTLIAMGNLASALRLKGEYDRAETLYRSVLATRLHVLGPEHPSSLLIQTYLGETLRLQRRLPEAESLQRKTEDQRRRVLGPDHPDTVHSMYLLALVLTDEGRLADAEGLCRQAVERARTLLGDTALETLRATDQLAEILLRQSRWPEAESAARAALAGWTARAQDLWQVGAAQSRLGAALLGQRRIAEARPLLAGADRQLHTWNDRIPAPDRQIVLETGQRLALAEAR